MQETRYAVVDGEKIPVLLSDENRGSPGGKGCREGHCWLMERRHTGNEWCAADTLIADVEDADEEFLGRIARRHLGLPWAICETERLKIREIAEGDYEEIVENHVDADLDTVEKVAGYTKHHYEVFEFGFWAVEEKKSGNLTGVVGFRIPQDDGIGDVDYYVLSLDDENILDDTLELGYHIFPEYRRKDTRKRHAGRRSNTLRKSLELSSLSSGSGRKTSCQRRSRKAWDSCGRNKGLLRKKVINSARFLLSNGVSIMYIKHCIQTTQIQFDDTRVTSLKVRLKPACRRSFKFVPGNAKHSDGRTRV